MDIEAQVGTEGQNEGTEDWRPHRRTSSIVSRSVTLSPAQQAMEKDRALSIHSIPQAESLRSAEADEGRPSSQIDRKPATASLSTRIILQNFEKVVAQEGFRAEDIQFRKDQAKKAADRRAKNLQVFDEYKEHIIFGYKPVFDFIPKKLLAGSIHPMPKKAAMDEMVRTQYPPRSEIRVRVCDFGPGKFDSFWTTVGKAQDYWLEKPDWVTVRWLDVPIGYGMLQSSIEDMFNHAGDRGRPFERAGSSDWPYVAIDVLTLKHKNQVLHEREGYTYLSQEKAYENGPTASVFDGMSNELKVDLEWRANHLGSKVSFWDMVSFDFSRELQEGKSLGQDTPSLATIASEDIVETQVFSEHPLYKNALLMRNYFRAFHRNDGFLLTFSQQTGVDYLDRDLNEHLQEPTDLLLTNDDASGLAHCAQAFIETGTDTWHRKSVEWLVVYIMTEMAVTPHNIRKGRQGLSIMGAYRIIAQDLKRRRNAPWRKNETVKLVREYLKAIDELTAVKSITGKKLHVFQGMVEDCERMENEDDQAGVEINPYGESAIERVQWALQIIKEMDDDCTKLLSDLQVALNELFQLRSIEQNELAIITDGQNKAILLFTGVTIIFLPLSFFTSYFGMNLVGISGTTKNEAYFWKACGSFSLVFVLVMCVYGFRQTLLSQFLRMQRHAAPRT